MSFFQQIAKLLLTLAVVAILAVGAWRIVTHKSSGTEVVKPALPASIAKVVKEADLNTITLTEDAERRLGLKVGIIEMKPARRVRVYGGEVMVPVGKAIPVSAPLGGILKAPAGGGPHAGQKVKAGQTIFQLIPLLTPEGRATVAASLADADGQVKAAKAQVKLADIALERAKRVLKEGAGSQRQVDEAQTAFDVASRTLDAAELRRKTLALAIGEGEGGSPQPIAIDAPEDGILRVVSALPGQTVPLGGALFEVVDLSTVWIRVALPVDDLDSINSSEPAQVGKLSAPPGTSLMTAKPIPAPPSANVQNSTVDLYYEMPNPKSAFIPGQRVGVAIALADAPESLTIPWSAVVFDFYGGTWIYEEIGSRQYVRRRVVVKYTVGADAVLESGPPAGSKIVTLGVQELFGAETGFVR